MDDLSMLNPPTREPQRGPPPEHHTPHRPPSQTWQHKHKAHKQQPNAPRGRGSKQQAQQRPQGSISHRESLRAGLLHSLGTDPARKRALRHLSIAR
eukprot:scaffold53275_cov32-Tisochrysis_lutea.AAC.1